ncbi:uncharacterized protein BDZ99DRAFT_135581 [Mytilinidion resinicola]|uniref:C2H2-type domain-containing protein n=1 Tax=Mytilinidion resinicola TaxID=574789 RepID=A0A6A6Z805_9PEZI|nr:uncharacterized protein BDZ99DRAFT_135581 [Mytilinidion resinicola]KAF2816405.1 hypothetical protein BDZ99DRAFT_135581 [Mytilinidion resinicola]
MESSPATASAPTQTTTQPSTSTALTTVSPLNTIPQDIALHRALLFALDTPVQLTPQVWEKFWPYIDNVWCVHQKPQGPHPSGISKVYGGCRLIRKTNFPPPPIHENSRPRQRREGGTCKAKFRLTIYPDGKRQVERTGEPHSHTLEHIDSIKRNSGVRKLVLDDFFKSWEAGGILAYLRDTAHQADGRDLLKEAGGLYLSRQEVQNIMNGALKKAYPGQDISEVKKQMDKYKTYTTCNFKGCDAPAFPDIKSLMDHRKAVHGLKSHDHSDKVYSCPDKSCWRRKKSKGFATLLGLEEHMREKHSNGAIDGDLTANGNDDMDVDDTAGESSMMGASGLLSGFDLTLDPQLQAPMAQVQQQILGDPITPASSTPGSDGQQQNAQVEPEAPRIMSESERESMKLRLKRLEIERNKLDQEISRLNRVLFGDAVATGSENHGAG